MLEPEWIDAVVKESLRLTPVLPIVGRTLQRDMELGGVLIPRGARAAPNVYLAHREESSWPDAHRFLPPRFLGAKSSPYTFLPFGGGVRRCIGMAFALLEMRIVIETVLRKVRIAATDTPIRIERRGVALAPSDGLPIVLSDR